MGDSDFGDSTHTHIEPPCLDQEPDFVDQVLSVLDYSGANPARLKLEITENMLLKDIEGTIMLNRSLK